MKPSIKTKAVQFVFLGKSLPKYAKASLDLAVRYGGLEVQLLGNSGIKSDVSSKDVNFIAIEDFYNPTEFLQASSLSLSDKAFRDGFWLKTLERFFVLEQYFKAADLQTLFHAELDQLLFRNDILVGNLESLENRGVFFPFHSRKEGIASVFFCNNHESLRSFIDFSMVDAFQNEMTLLGDWAADSPKHVFALPTLGSVIGSSPKAFVDQVQEVNHKEIGGIVDAAQLGQWVGGIDPKHVPISDTPKTKYFNSSSDRCVSLKQLQKIKFQLNKNDDCLSINFDGNMPLQVFNLHLHSKAHKSLSGSDSRMYEFFKWANSDESRSLRGTRKEQLLDHFWPRLQFFLDDPRRLIYGLWRRIIRLFNFRQSS